MNPIKKDFYNNRFFSKAYLDVSNFALECYQIIR